MPVTDRLGHALTAASSSDAERFDAAVESLLYFSVDVAEAWEATVVDDPSFVMGHVGRAYLRSLSSEGPDAADARSILEPLGNGSRLTDRERRHLEAARSYALGDLRDASDRLSALSVEYPRDALALAVGHQLDFFCGDALTLRDRIGRALMSWDSSDPWFGFVLGMQAFGLEECGLYPQAEAAGLRALDHERRDVWAHHAVIHSYEMQARIEHALAFIDGRRVDWTDGNFFVVHNAWHEALFLLETCEHEAALHIYDTIIHVEGSENVALELVDASALLWRLELDDVDVGGRWDPLAEAWAGKMGAPWYAFNDAHAVMAFVGAGRLDDARTVVARLQAYVEADGDPAITNRSMTADVGLPVASAIAAFGEGRYDEVVRLLQPIRTFVQRFGGSHAQRDAVARTLLEAAIRGGDAALARAVVSERIALKDSSPYNRRQLARVRRADTDDAGALAAESKATDLQSFPVPTLGKAD